MRLAFLAMLVPFAGVAAPPALAGVIGPTKASALVNSELYAPLLPCGTGPNGFEVVLSTAPAVGEVLVVTSFSWHITGMSPNSPALVWLSRSNDMGTLATTVAQSVAVANAAGEAVGSVALQPGVAALKPVDGLTHLCLQNGSAATPHGDLVPEGSLHGYIAPDR